MSTIEQNIPMLDLAPELDALWDDMMKAIQGVLRSGQFILGPNVAAFEREVADYFGVKHAIGLNSGTDALVLGLRALGVGVGDEVITTPFTFFATAEAISHLGATPVFADIEADTFNLDVTQAEQLITPRTKAIIPVHLFGQSVDVDAVRDLANRYGLKVLEDVAQAFGATHRGHKLGTIGDAGAFSFFPTKNLGGYGDGGLLVTNDDTVADEVRMLRAHGSRRKYHNEAIGYNSRLDELQAAILRIKLPHIDEYNAGRRRVASRYDELLGGVDGVILPVGKEDAYHIYHQYTVRITGGRRGGVQQRLAAAGIGTMVYYPIPVHRLPVYESLGYSLPVSEAAAAEVLSLPIWPQMEDAGIARVVEACTRAVQHE